MIRTRTNRGIAKVPNGYIVAEVEFGVEDSGASPEQVMRRKLIDGPFKGPGSKARAIEVAGTNRVVPA